MLMAARPSPEPFRRCSCEWHFRNIIPGEVSSTLLPPTGWLHGSNVLFARGSADMHPGTEKENVASEV
jgi:hypothetical protein